MAFDSMHALTKWVIALCSCTWSPAAYDHDVERSRHIRFYESFGGKRTLRDSVRIKCTRGIPDQVCSRHFPQWHSAVEQVLFVLYINVTAWLTMLAWFTVVDILIWFTTFWFTTIGVLQRYYNLALDPKTLGCRNHGPKLKVIDIPDWGYWSIS